MPTTMRRRARRWRCAIRASCGHSSTSFGSHGSPDSATMPEQSLRVLIVDQNLIRASILEEGLREAGYRDLIVVRDMQNLLRRIVDEEPDVILIDLENPNRDVLEQMCQVSRVVSRPVAMFVDS